MRTNEDMMHDLAASGVLHSPHIVHAFEAVDRIDFVPHDSKSEAYGDYPLPIPDGQTISQPYTVAFMMELLHPESGQRILDVGSGSGWTTALLAHIVGAGGSVVATEIIPELVTLGTNQLARYDFPHAKIRHAEHDTLGAPDKAPFDRILVSAASDNIPHELVEQLAPNGILVMPIKNSVIRLVKHADGTIETRTYEGFAFVPLL
jgi:protein-L-isoaspartate(D-aspartate) O-methyltransferase